MYFLISQSPTVPPGSHPCQSFITHVLYLQASAIVPFEQVPSLTPHRAVGLHRDQEKPSRGLNRRFHPPHDADTLPPMLRPLSTAFPRSFHVGKFQSQSSQRMDWVPSCFLPLLRETFDPPSPPNLFPHKPAEPSLISFSCCCFHQVKMASQQLGWGLVWIPRNCFPTPERKFTRFVVSFQAKGNKVGFVRNLKRPDGLLAVLVRVPFSGPSFAPFFDQEFPNIIAPNISDTKVAKWRPRIAFQILLSPRVGF